MKKLIIFCWLLLLAQLCLAQTESVVNNTSPSNYYIGAYFTVSANGNCPSAALDTFYHDFPNYTISTVYAIDGSGNTISSVANISGITIQLDPSGTPYAIPFCMSGSPAASGYTSIPVPNASGMPFTIITWSINTGTNQVFVNFY